jgi:hypothetical protein
LCFILLVVFNYCDFSSYYRVRKVCMIYGVPRDIVSLQIDLPYGSILKGIYVQYWGGLVFRVGITRV